MEYWALTESTAQQEVRDRVAHIVRRLFRCRCGGVPPDIDQTLGRASLEQLLLWAEQALDAKVSGECLEGIRPSGSHVDVHIETLDCVLTRITDRRYREAFRNSISIQEDYPIIWEIERHLLREGRSPLNLSEFYAAFADSFGESGSCYDDWKGAFNFAFGVEVLAKNKWVPYCLNVINFRSSIEFRFRKIISSNETQFDRLLLYPPFTEELSMEQMKTLSAYLYGYVSGRWEWRHVAFNREFLKEVSSNLILFGYQDGEFFEIHYRDQEEFEAAKEQRIRRSHSSSTA